MFIEKETNKSKHLKKKAYLFVKLVNLTVITYSNKSYCLIVYNIVYTTLLNYNSN